MSGNSKKQVSNLSNNLIRHSVHFAVLAALAAAGVATRAQAQQAPASTDTAPLQEVIVTGTMIKRANAETAEAITIIKADSLKDQGIVNVEQAMNTLTSNTPSVNIAQSVGTFPAAVLTPTCAASAIAAPWCSSMANGWPPMPSAAMRST